MNKGLLKSHMAKHGDNQDSLAKAIGISLSCLNAKINENKTCFTLAEIIKIGNRYQLSTEEIGYIFFASQMSQKDK